jgi:zinc-ribbon domain
MFCPKCASQNIDGASFCRVCGANISLVPQALSGQLPIANDESREARRSRRRRSKEPSLEHAVKNIFIGVAFLFVSLALARSFAGVGWWFWMLIPAFSCMGTGVAEYIRFREERRKPLPLSQPIQPSFSAAPRVASLPPRNTGELVPPPPSVTEGTTRHLGAEAPTRHLDASNEVQK